MKKILVKVIRITGITILLLLVILAFLFTNVDRTQLEDTVYYNSSIEEISQTEFPSFSDTVRAGWARINITPENDPPLAGYGDRRGVRSTGISDSVYLRCLWLENDKTTVVVISGDILIFPPLLRQHLVEYLESLGLSANNLYLSASHTHSSLGGWAPGLVGQLIIGDFDEQVLLGLKQQSEELIKKARGNLSPVSIGYKKFRTKEIYRNRIVGSDGIISPWLKTVKLSREDGRSMVMVSYPSHPTIHGSSNLEVSGDYPGALLRLLDSSSQFDMGMFMAGPMASMGRPELGHAPAENIEATSKLLFDSISSASYEVTALSELGSREVPFALGSAQVRISKNIRIRPWLFTVAFGDPELYLSTMKLNNMVFISTPCDFSGEIAYRIDSASTARGQEILINSFNGSYIGYITDDKWYDRLNYETREMNWFGPNNGTYFTRMIEMINEGYQSK